MASGSLIQIGSHLTPPPSKIWKVGSHFAGGEPPLTMPQPGRPLAYNLW